MSSLPKNIEIPRSSGQFAKLAEGKNKFRVLSDAIVGWEGWKNKKPFRHEGQVCRIKPEDVDLNQSGYPNINYFWAMVVWNYNDNKIQVLEITQKTIMGALQNLEETPEWGDLKNYDIQITRSKVGDKTTYTVAGIPPKPVSSDILTAYEKSEVDLKKLFKGEYPMSESKNEIDHNDIPFN